MSGTPVLSAIREGLAGTPVVLVRGILNGTAVLDHRPPDINPGESSPGS